MSQMRKMKLVFGLAVGALGMSVGCGPFEECSRIDTCGSATLYACSTHEGCRYKSSDGHSWSCNATEDPPYGHVSCSSTSCSTAAQEAADWCAYESPGR
jgi:hypothetical protein